MLKLIGTNGDHFFSFDIEPGKYLIGRNPQNDFCIPDKTISRRHAKLEFLSDGECFLEDMGSHNGTTVNGRAVTTLTRISPGDLITFGKAEFRLADAEPAPIGHSQRPTTTPLSEVDPEKSVYMSIDEALSPLPAKVTDLQELFPALSELARTLVLHEPKDVMLRRALELVNRVIPAERLAVLLADRSHEDIYTAATLLPSGKAPGSFTLSRTIVNDILTQQQSVLIANPLDDPKYAQQQSIIGADLKSAMAVPLFDEGVVLGILYVDTTNPLHHYNDDYLRLLATFGNIIASRLVNYNLLKERQEKKVIEAEIQRAALIQKRLLVAEEPELDRYSVCAFQHQCRAVGGDLYDMAILPDRRFLVLVGDVSGKGMGAALLMSNILASFRILYEDESFDLIRAVRRVSRELCRYSDTGDFATLFAGLIDVNKNEMLYVNAGHNPPSLIHHDGSVNHLEATGLMIGAFDFADWEAQSVQLQMNDLLVVFSDGVTEAEGETGQYGETRLDQFLQSHHQHDSQGIADLLVQDIEQFTEGTPQSDDITLLLVKRDN